MDFGMPSLLALADARASALAARRLGLAFVELNMNLPQYQAGRLDPEELRALTAETGVRFTLHADERLDFCDFNPLVRAAWTDTALAAVRLARKAGMPSVNFHLPDGVYFTLPAGKRYLYEEYAGEALAAAARFRDTLSEAAGDGGPLLLLENCGGWRPFQRDMLERFLEDPAFGLTWDVGHDHGAKNADRPFLLAHAGRIRHMHFHDAAGGRSHLAPGTGEVPLAEHLTFAREHGLRCVLEVKDLEGLAAAAAYVHATERNV